MAANLTLREPLTEEDLDKVFALQVGDVVKVVGHYGSIIHKVLASRPEGLLFDLYPINAGTDLYTMYGPDHCVVTQNEWKP